jgi:hypothetical protein
MARSLFWLLEEAWNALQPYLILPPKNVPQG